MSQQAMYAWGSGQGDGRRRAAWLCGHGGGIHGARPWRCGSSDGDSRPIRAIGTSRGRGEEPQGPAGAVVARASSRSSRGSALCSRSPWCLRNPPMRRDDVHVQGLILVVEITLLI